MPDPLAVSNKKIINRFLAKQRQTCRLTHSVNQNVNTGVLTAIAFDTEKWDPSGLHDTVTNNTRITPGVGIYGLGAYLVYQLTAALGTYRDVRICNNGDTNNVAGWSRVPPCNGVPDGPNGSCMWEATLDTDYFELYAQQDSGGTIAVSKNINSPALWLWKFS